MTYDRMVFGMHHLNISQIGSKYDGKNHLSHTSYELDLAGEDSGIDYYFNKLPNTAFKCTGRWGTRSTGNTFFFVTCDASGQTKKVLCADGAYRVITLALTHSNRDAVIGKVYGYNSILVSEGTQGMALGNHIHLEVCEGLVTRKIPNIKNYYNLPNMLDARKVFWILDGWTTVVNTQGLKFLHCKEVPVKPKEETGGKEMLYLQPKKVGANIRKALTFSKGKNTSEIVGFVPVGSKARITHFTERFEADGYEWCQVEFEGVSGYCQMDTKSYLVRWD